MPADLRIKRGTRAQVNAAAAASGLAAGQPLLITDEGRLAVGLSATTYAAAAKQGEGMERPHGCTLLDPTTSDTKIVLCRVPRAMTITHLHAVLPRGTSTPSVSFTIRHGADVSATGTALITAGTTVTSTTSGTSVTSFNSAAVSSGHLIWLDVTAKSGTVPMLHVTLAIE
jgi:hypothetical protein